MADEKQLVVNLALKAGTMKQQINSINKDIKQLQTDFKNAGAGVEDFEKTSEGLSSKLKLQQSVIEKLKDKLSVYKQEQEKCTATLDKAVSAYQKQEQKVKSLNQALKEAEQEYGKNSEKVKTLEEKLKKAEKALKTKKNSVINANNALTHMNTTISSTEAEMKGMERQIGQTTSALDELDDSASEVSGSFENFGDKLKSVASSAVKNLAKISAAMVTAGAGAVSVLTKLSVEQYARYEQLVGGIETLFKDSSDKAIEYANNAYKASGFSANEYMDTITGFAASLLQGLGGDTEKAVEIGNMAVQDMSDNANKMGTVIRDIQNAYQGFAKDNYTMLDNLKLGYGGTKGEMERLLADAEKLTGLEYRIENFNDVIEAIHVIQTEMGITGTTALEAATTIEGSFNMTKSAWSNLLTGMADDEADFDGLINNLVDSASTFGEIIIPRIEIAIQGIGQLVEKLLPPIVARLPQLITDVLPDLITAGANMIESLVNGISQALPQISQIFPQIIDAGVQIAGVLGKALIDVAPMLLEAGLQLILTLGQGISSGLPEMIPTIVDVVVNLCDMIINNLPMIIDVALDIIIALAEGLINALPTLIEEVPRIINSFCNAIYDKLPDILKAGIEIIIMLVKGLIDSIPIIIENLPQIIMAIVNVFTMMNWWSIGENLIANIGSGISSMVGNIGTIAKNLATNVVNAIKGIFTSNGGSIGQNLISFISTGISSMLSGIVSVARNIGTSVVNVFRNMFSMSTMAEIGQNLVKGIWNGISNMTGWIINLIGGFAGSVVSSIKSFFSIGGGKSGRSADYPSGRSRMIYEPESLNNIGTLSLDNVALSGSYYNANTRDSINANTMIRQVNGASQTSRYDGMMNSMVSILYDMNKAIQEIKDSNDSTIIMKNYMDSEEISSYTYKKVDNKFALAGRSRR